MTQAVAVRRSARARLPGWLSPANLAAGIVFLALSLIVLVWSDGFMISTLDWHIPYDRSRFFHDLLFAWNYSQFGTLSAQFVALFPFALYLAVTDWAGWSHVLAQNVLFSTCVFFAGFGMYAVYRLVLPASKNRLNGWLAATLAGAFYVVNPFTAYRMSGHLIYGESVYVFLPLVFALFARGLKLRGGWRAGLATAFVAAVCFAPGGTTPKFLAIAWAILLSYAFFSWLIATDGRRHIVAFTSLFLVSWILLSSWYLLLQVTISNQLLARSAAFHAAIDLTEEEKFPRGSMDLIDAFRQTEAALVEQRTERTDHSAVFVLSGFVPALLAFSALFDSRRRVIVLYFMSLVAVGLSLLNRSRYPSGDVLQWILTQVGLLRIFRTPIVPFGVFVAFAYAVPLGVGTETFLDLASRYVPGRFLRRAAVVTLSLCLFVLCCVVFNWVLWSGDVFAEPAHVPPRYEIPDHYVDAANWLGEMPGDFRVFAFPLSNMGYYSYAWDQGYYGRDVIERLFPKRVIFNNAPSLSGDLSSVWYDRRLWGTHGLSKLLALTNTRYMAVRGDVRIDHFRNSNFMNWSDSIPSSTAIENLPGFRLVESFDQLDFYENESWQPMQAVAAVRSVTVKDMEEQIQLLSDDSLPFGQDLVLVPQAWLESYGPDGEQGRDLQHPEVFTVQMLNPVTYRIHVKTDSAFYLVLSEFFHPDWKVYIGQHPDWTDSLTNAPLAESTHFVANGFSNGWYIREQGEYDILLYFRQQNRLYAGALVSLLALVVGSLLIIRPPRTIWRKIVGETSETSDTGV